MELTKTQFGDMGTIKRTVRGVRMHPIYAASAGLTLLVLVVAALWLYTSALSSELPSLPPGMKFVGGRP